MWGFIISGIVGCYIPLIGGLFWCGMLGGSPSGFELSLILLAPFPAGFLSGLSVFKLFESSKFTTTIPKVGFYIVSGMMGFCLLLVMYFIFLFLGPILSVIKLHPEVG